MIEKEFWISMMGKLTFFLGIQVKQTEQGTFIGDAAQQTFAALCTRRRIRWSTPSTDTSRAKPVKESIPWCCQLEIATM
jgi:hypothetical protein